MAEVLERIYYDLARRLKSKNRILKVCLALSVALTVFLGALLLKKSK